jgi:hypothetical protein
MTSVIDKQNQMMIRHARSHLWVPLGLEVGNDGRATQTATADHRNHLSWW